MAICSAKLLRRYQLKYFIKQYTNKLILKLNYIYIFSEISAIFLIQAKIMFSKHKEIWLGYSVTDVDGVYWFHHHISDSLQFW